MGDYLVTSGTVSNQDLCVRMKLKISVTREIRLEKKTQKQALGLSSMKKAEKVRKRDFLKIYQMIE